MNILNIKIANINLHVCIQSELTNIYNLFSLFSKSKTINAQAKINIFNGRKNNISFPKDMTVLTIRGRDINNLQDPFNLIGILQATFRFVAFHSCKNGVLLLHGSSSVYRKKAICFLDDNNGSIKSASSIECALISGEYLGDEFCFLDTKSMTIFSYKLIPIHFRPIVEEHVRKNHGVNIHKGAYGISPAGYFVYPDSLFTVKESAELGAFVYIKLADSYTHSRFVRSKKQIKELMFASLGTHMLKLLSPNLDRMNFCERSDTSETMILNASSLENIVFEYIPQKSFEKILDNVPFLTISADSPCKANNELLRKLDALFKDKMRQEIA